MNICLSVLTVIIRVCVQEKVKKYKTIVSGASKIRGEQMKKLNSKQLKTIRIFIIIIGILISFVIWLFLPDVINNNALFHVGNGKYGSKLGALLLVLIPLFGFIPGRMDEEIHTKDSMERVELKEKFDKRSEEIQIAVAFFCSVVACLAMLCGLALC